MSKPYFALIEKLNAAPTWPSERPHYHSPKKKYRIPCKYLGGLGLVLILAAVGVVGAAIPSGGTDQEALSASTVAASTIDVEADPDLSDVVGSAPTHEASPECKAALKKGKRYAGTLHMSRRGVYKQLTSNLDKFTPEAAQYAIDNMDDTHWDAAALTKAKSYVKTMSMTPQAIHDQLTSDAEGFTSEEADYAIQHLND